MTATGGQANISISRATVSVNYRAVSGTAKREIHFNEAEGTVTFPPLTLTKQITVRVRQDRIPESSETFTVVLSRASNAAIGKGTGVGTIIDDDTPALATAP